MEREVSSWDWRGWTHVLTLLLVAILAAPHAEAAPGCTPYSSVARNADIQYYPQDVIMAGANPDAFYVVTWYCDAKYVNKPHYVVGYVRDLPPNFISIGRQLLAMTLGDFQAAWEQGIAVKSPCRSGATENAYTPLCETVRTQLRLTLPAPIDWFVANNPQSTSRPVFSVTNTNGVWTRNTSAVASVRVSDTGSRCIPTHIVIEESGGVYASVMGLPNVSTAQPDDVIGDNLVALCVRTN